MQDQADGPQAQGLYDPQHEKDACGVGFVVHLKGNKSHDIVQKGLELLVNLEHRGASGCEANTGDGAGMLLQMPDRFFRALRTRIRPAARRRVRRRPDLPAARSVERATLKSLIARIVAEQGQTLLGWRSVPTDDSSLGDRARAVEPVFEQLFIGQGSEARGAQVRLSRANGRVRRLSSARSTSSASASRSKPCAESRRSASRFYVVSLSSKTLIYKGMLTAAQIAPMFPDLARSALESALALCTSASAPTRFRRWPLAHPYRYVAHNGEINTLRGNINWMRAREGLLQSDLFGDDLKNVLPVIREGGSDTATFDNVLEFLVMGGRSLPHAMLMMIPEPWQNHAEMIGGAARVLRVPLVADGAVGRPGVDRLHRRHRHRRRARSQRPASVALLRHEGRPRRDGVRSRRARLRAREHRRQGAPAAGQDVPRRHRSRPHHRRRGAEGRARGRAAVRRVGEDEPHEHRRPARGAARCPSPITPRCCAASRPSATRTRICACSWRRWRSNGEEALGSMGTDTPLAVLSDRPQLLYDYFKQLFAQVTNPPLDAIREELVTSMGSTIGPEGNLLDPQPESCRADHDHVSRDQTTSEVAKLRHLGCDGFKTTTLPMLYRPGRRTARARAGDGTTSAAAPATRSPTARRSSSCPIAAWTRTHAPIPSLLATAGVHHHLVREGTRTQLRAGHRVRRRARGAPLRAADRLRRRRVNPYLAFETLDDMIRQEQLPGLTHDKAVRNYIKALNKGILKVMSKMGISTLASYCGAQIFEAIGLNQAFVDRYFTGTPSRIEGVGIDVVSEEVAAPARQGVPAAARRPDGSRLGRRVPVAPRRRVPPVQSGDGLQAAARDAQRAVHDLQGIHVAGGRPEPRELAHAARPVRLQARQRRRCRSTRSSRSSRSSSASPPARCRSARSAPRRTRRSPSR